MQTIFCIQISYGKKATILNLWQLKKQLLVSPTKPMSVELYKDKDKLDQTYLNTKLPFCIKSVTLSSECLIKDQRYCEKVVAKPRRRRSAKKIKHLDDHLASSRCLIFVLWRSHQLSRCRGPFWLKATCYVDIQPSQVWRSLNWHHG